MPRPSFLRRVVALLVCLATLAGAPLPSVAAAGEEPPCAMTEAGPAGGAPCEGCEGQGKASCVQQCAAFHAGAVLLLEASRSPLAIGAERVAARASAPFDSYAGPPGFQPPR